MGLKQLATRIAIAAFAAFASVTLVSTAALAQAPAGLPQVALTPAIVQAFMASYPAVTAQTAVVGKKYNVKSGAGGPDGGWGAWMTVPAAWGELGGVVAPYGYANFKAWLDVSISVSLAYTYAKAGPALDNVGGAAAAAGNSSLLPQSQRQLLAQGAAALAALRPSQQNIDAVKPYLAQLGPLLKQ